MSAAVTPALPAQPRADALSNGDSLYEVIDGQRVELPSMGVYSSRLANRLSKYLDAFVTAHQLGSVDVEMLFILNATKKMRRRPDVAFVSKERWPLDRPLPFEGDWDVVPDLAIEVISPNDAYTYTTRKIRDYFKYGVRQVWLVQPEIQEIDILDSPDKWHRIGLHEVLESALLPGFRLPVAELFAQPVTAPPPPPDGE